MSTRLINGVFCGVFAVILLAPLLLLNADENAVSNAEKRRLASFPALVDEGGLINGGYLGEFDNWFCDRVGFRDQMVQAVAFTRYRVFGLLSGDYSLGPGGEANYSSSAIIKDFQRFNLRKEEDVQRIAKSYETVSGWLEEKGIQFYYMQCRDKHSIYPEQFPASVAQYGERSKTDQIVDALKESAKVTIVDPKEDLIQAKERYETYGWFSDPTHWTRRGAYIGYLALMQAINNRNDGQFRVLGEDDYDLALSDQGTTFFGCIHEVDMLEKFDILHSNAEETNNKLSYLNEDSRHIFYTNESVDNDVRLLVLGDSYINSYILDDLAESFHETLIIWGDHAEKLSQIVDAYNPDILVMECAERVDRSEAICTLANSIKQNNAV